MDAEPFLNLSREQYGDNEVVRDSLRQFLLHEASIAVKTKEHVIQKLIDLLEEDSSAPRFERSTRYEVVLTLKTLARDPQCSTPLTTGKGLDILANIALEESQGDQGADKSSSAEALKCLCNCLLLNPDARTRFSTTERIDRVALRYKAPLASPVDEFLLSRLMFLSLIGQTQLVVHLIEKGVVDDIAEHIRAYACLDRDRAMGGITSSMATSETLKLLYGLMSEIATETMKDRNLIPNDVRSKLFQSDLNTIIKCLKDTPALVPPTSHAVHCLLNLPIPEDPPDTDGTIEAAGDALLAIFDHTLTPLRKGDIDAATTLQNRDEIEQTLASLSIAMTRLAWPYERLRAQFKHHILPEDIDRTKSLTEGESTRAVVTRIMTSAMLTNTKTTVSELLFVLCDEDASKLVHAVGYGNAAGFLLLKGIPMPQTESNDTDDIPINPITGQYLTQEANEAWNNMTDEEKEREAERLFVLFERLNKTGIIQVDNPVAQAIRNSSAHVEEIDDDEDD
ncbi:hypothetical protein BZG36_00914 [Bifiguratus adelaidae]|uniref:Synembryn-A n=1 Tax=Bifiguratus adelaidae TaxID=1938954 RepID=A0A261Y5J1_9FUNG|nr:hypothetical protein BZG36_00914 [Bifiguratus adelaidae]